MFELSGVRYGDILDIPALTLHEQKVTTLVGTSGSGKTTLLRLLNKLISPTEGEILYHGENLADIPSVAHRRNVAMLSQVPVLFDGSVRDNLTAGFRFQNRPHPPDEDLQEMMERVRLNKPLDSETDMLSGGEKQRLSLGRVMLLGPDVYLLDEPSSALDDLTEDQIIQMLMHHVREQNRTLILVTHARRIAESYSDRIIEMAGGTIREGSPS